MVRDERRILRQVSKSLMSAVSLKLLRALPISEASRTRSYLKISVTLRTLKVGHEPSLSPQHKKHRLKCSRQHVTRNVQSGVWWCSPMRSGSIWTAYLDCPDDFNYYLRDIRKGEVVISRRQNGVEWIMVWGAFPQYRVCDMAVLKDRQNTAC